MISDPRFGSTNSDREITPNDLNVSNIALSTSKERGRLKSMMFIQARENSQVGFCMEFLSNLIGDD
jgi:hypothetical protein